jgi:hypothetical protein
LKPLSLNPILSCGSSPDESRAGEQTPASPIRLEAVERGMADRASLESFIDARFDHAYGAKPTHFCPQLLGVRDDAGRWQAAVGYASARDEPLFLEQYLDAPVEVVLSRAFGRAVDRARVVEVGNLAAIDAGMARRLIAELARRFHREGYRWAAFTATSEVRNSFRRLRLVPVVLARADRARLRQGADSWGDYYSHDPLVMGGPILAGLGAKAR